MSFGIKQLEENYQGLERQFVRVDSVILPPWANSRHYFLYKMYCGLEHPFIRQTLDSWINLMFGDKQQDPNSYNMFKPLTCEKYVRLREESENKLDPSELIQIAEFGNNPIQIFDKPHPEFDSKFKEEAKYALDFLYPAQRYMVTIYKPKEFERPNIIRIMVKDKNAIYTINDEYEICHKMYFSWQ